MTTDSASRVADNTAPSVNERIKRQTDERVAQAAASGPEAIAARLVDLDQEWDVERCLEMGASSLCLVGLTLGTTVNRRWYLLPAVVASFLLQHALQGWCPPLPVFRRLGVRTRDEINEERFALKAVRGDFQKIDTREAGAALEAVRRAH